MKESEYRSIYSVEDGHWWYEGLRDLVFSSLREAMPGKVSALDAGCGTGAVLKRLLDEGQKAVGVDFSPTALSFCAQRGLARLVRGSVSELPFRDESFDAVVSLDVIYHEAVEDDVEALREFRRVLRKGGVLILNLPAFEFLRSPHDLANQTKRRYTKAMLAEKLKSAGFSIERVTYRNAALFPAIAIVRLLKKAYAAGDSKDSDLGKVNPALNRALTGVLSLENVILRRLDMPFGSSVFGVARKA